MIHQTATGVVMSAVNEVLRIVQQRTAARPRPSSGQSARPADSSPLRRLRTGFSEAHGLVLQSEVFPRRYHGKDDARQFDR